MEPKKDLGEYEALLKQMLEVPANDSVQHKRQLLLLVGQAPREHQQALFAWLKDHLKEVKHG